MKEERKNAYIASAIVLLIGLVFFAVMFSQDHIDKVMLVFASFFSGAGLLGIAKPEIGEIIAHWMEKQKGGSRTNNRQNIRNAKHSPQVISNNGDVNIHYGSSTRRSKK